MGMLYTTVVQEVILCGSYMWVVFPHIRKTLRGFHHQVVRILTGQTLQRKLEMTWTYPTLEEEMVEVVLKELDNYITRCQNTVAKFIATRPIVDLCLAAARCSGARFLMQWWEKEGINLEGIHEADWEMKSKR